MGLAAAGYLARGAADLMADPLGFPIGSQTWTVRESIGKDFDGTLRLLAADGYKAIEMCSPPGYEDSGFGPLMSIKAAEMRQRIHAAGLVCESCHYGFDELKEHLDERVAFAKELGLKQMIIASFGLPRTRPWRTGCGPPTKPTSSASERARRGCCSDFAITTSSSGRSTGS